MRIPVWTVCDRCSFVYYRKQMRKESEDAVVCISCFDGEYDSQNHPQNYPARTRREPTPVPNGRPSVDLTNYILSEDSGMLLTEDGLDIQFTGETWTP